MTREEHMHDHEGYRSYYHVHEAAAPSLLATQKGRMT
jgi:hypothetical protein